MLSLLLTASVLLRGFVAPGYMPNLAAANAASPIVICSAEGLRTILVTAKQTPFAPKAAAHKNTCDFALNKDVLWTFAPPAPQRVLTPVHYATIARALGLSPARPPYLAQAPPRFS